MLRCPTPINIYLDQKQTHFKIFTGEEQKKKNGFGKTPIKNGVGKAPVKKGTNYDTDNDGIDTEGNTKFVLDETAI